MSQPRESSPVNDAVISAEACEVVTKRMELVPVGIIKLALGVEVFETDQQSCRSLSQSPR